MILSDGCSICVPENSVKIAYSNQLMEHLHPDDAFEQLGNIYQTLVPSGVYVCVTPNYLTGPHDISRYYDDVATGFHLKEYTVTELSQLFKRIGFIRVRTYARIKGIRVFLPLFVVKLCEKGLSVLPNSLRKTLASSRIVSKLLGIRIIGVK